jgi:hypothetical protein
MSAPSDDEWETVHTVHDFWDGPRSGVADFHGKPHAYCATFDREADDYSEIYELSPISSDQLEAVTEAWQMWLRWSEAFAANSLEPDDHHPRLAIDRNRYEELHPLVEQALAIDPRNAVRAIPTFRLDPSMRKRRLRSRGLQVRWSVINQGASPIP